MLMEDIEVKVYRSGIKLPVIFFVPATFLATVYVLLYLLVNSQLFVDEGVRFLNAELPGTFALDELVVEPNLTEIHLWGATVHGRDGARIVDAREVHAGINPIPLLVRRIRIDHALVRHTRFDMAFYPNDHMNLLDALGLEGGEDDDEGKDLISSISLGNLRAVDSGYSLTLDLFRFNIPSVTLNHGEVDISDESLVMQVPALDVDRVDFEFDPRLFYFPRSAGLWRFSAENVEIRNWAWAGDGFSVERVATHVGGVELAATGTMFIPDVADGEDTRLIYHARGTATIPPWSRTGQYFIDDIFHADARQIEIGVEGTLEGIVGEASFDFGVLDAYGVQVTDIEGTAALHDELVSIDRASGRLHGGLVDITDGFFNMFTGQFGGDATFAGVDPYGVARDIGLDYPYLEGTSRGAISIVGQVPFEEEYGPDSRSPYVGLDQFLSPTVEIRLDSDLVYDRRGPLDTLPGKRFRLQSGALIWATEDRLGIDDATIVADHATFEVDDFVFDWDRYELLRDQYGDIAHVEVRSDSLAGLAADYGASGVDGKLAATIDAVGRLNYPDVTFDVRVDRPSLEVGSLTVPGKRLTARGALTDGRLQMQRLQISSDRGNAFAKGYLDVLRDPRGLEDDEGEIVTDFLYPARHRVDLDASVDELDLDIVSEATGYDVAVTGQVDGELQLSGTLEDPDAAFSANGTNVIVMNQPLETVSLTGEIADRTYRVRDVVIDAGSAGRISGWGDLGFDDSIAFEVDGEGLTLAKIAPLAQTGVNLSGVADFHLHGSGTTSTPFVAGDVRVDDLTVDERKLGDVALVANTVGDTTHLVGALLPWVTVDIEIPLDGVSSYYARFGIDHLDVTDAVPELRRLRVIREAEATGTVEVFLEHDFSRYQVLANLSEVRVESLGKTFRNRGPIIAGLNDGNLLQIQQATIGTEDRWVSVQGGVFFDEALVDVQARGDLDLSLLTGLRLSFPQFFPESFLESTGLLALDVRVKGTPGLVVADGFVEFSPSEILLRDVSEPLTLLSGRIEFDRESVLIPDATPLRGRILGGVFSATGSLGLEGMSPQRLRANVWTHNMSYRVPDVANFTFDTRLAIDAPDLDRPDTWLVAGDIDILDGLYYENVSIFQEQLTNRIIGAFSRKTERYEAGIIEQFPALEEIGFNVEIRARDGFRIQNEIDRLALDLELRIDVRLQNTLPSPRVTGDIDVIDGRVTFQGEAFEVRTGTLSFYGDAGNPVIDIVAEADIFNTCRETDLSAEVSQTMSLSGVVDTGEQKSYHVTLNVRGPLDNMNIEFESNPYADQRDILSLLLTGCTVDQLTASSASSPTLEVALGPVLGWIEGQVQDVVDVEEFTITPSVDRLEATVGDSISRRLSWRLQLDTGLTEVATGQRFQVEYRLSDRWSAQASESSAESSQFDSFLVDFKLKYRIFID